MRHEFPRVSGREVEAVSGMERGESGAWRIQVETVELQRIPESTSVMATYELDVDEGGELRGFRRVRRYYRNQADEA